MNFVTKYGAVIVTLLVTLGAAIFTPSFIQAHPVVFAVLNMAAQVLHSVLPSSVGIGSVKK